MKTKIISFIAILFILTAFFGNTANNLSVFAEQTDSGTVSGNSSNKDSDKKSDSAASGENSDENEPKIKEPKIKDGTDEDYKPTASGLIIGDTKTGLIIYKENSDEKINPGSLVKVITAITAIEFSKDLDKKVKVPEGIFKNYTHTDGNLGLKSGDEITVANLISAMIMQDSGDCAVVLANTVCETYDRFIIEMNGVLKRSGAKNTSVSEPTGSEGKKQYSTLDDMFKIMRYASNNKKFLELTDKNTISNGTSGGNAGRGRTANTNRFMSDYFSESYYNANIHGIKGYYNDDDDCGMAVRYIDDTYDMIALCTGSDYVNSRNYAYEDIRYLLRKAYRSYSNYVLVSENDILGEIEITNGKESKRVLLLCKDEIDARLPNEYDKNKIEKKVTKNSDVKAPIKKGEKLGSVTVLYDGTECGKSDLIADRNIESSILNYIMHCVNTAVGSIYFRLILIIAAAAFILRMIQVNIRKRKN